MKTLKQKTLKQMYEELIHNKDEWSYYNYPPYLSVGTLYLPNKSFDFIKNYFKHGGKQGVLNDQYLQNNKEILDRSPHIISTYLLGILIARSFQIDVHTCSKNEINFKYLWFLACLYHDVGYAYENMNNCRILRMIQKNGLDAAKEEYNISYFDDDEFITYSKNLIDIYFSKRANCLKDKHGVIDHGIIGGLLLYDRLRKNFEEAWEQCQYQKNASKKSFEYNGLHFSEKHHEYYAKAADAIISHNIWIDTLKEYVENENEIKQEIKKIKSDNQIAFILALADTIEPIKKYGDSVLDKVYYEEIENGFKIYMPDAENKGIYKYIPDIEKWMDVDVKELSYNTFSISKRVSRV